MPYVFWSLFLNNKRIISGPVTTKSQWFFLINFNLYIWVFFLDWVFLLLIMNVSNKRVYFHYYFISNKRKKTWSRVCSVKKFKEKQWNGIYSFLIKLLFQYYFEIARAGTYQCDLQQEHCCTSHPFKRIPNTLIRTGNFRVKKVHNSPRNKASGWDWSHHFFCIVSIFIWIHLPFCLRKWRFFDQFE